ncbi:MAG TPA: hypothetical protein PKN47_20650 [Nitrospira sp.]|jgi:hypothetical protein|nr:hypothetical protein [Nitrospira sp.]
MRLLFALLFLILLGYGAYLGAIWGGEQHAILDPAEQPRAALIGALTILVVFILSGAIRSGSKELAQQGLLVQRYRLYQLTLGALQQQDLSTAMRSRIEQGLALLGSRAVIEGFRKLQESVASHGFDSLQSAELCRKLTMAMRADLGQSHVELRKAKQASLPKKD